MDCAECIRWGHWVRACTTWRGTALCRDHLLEIARPAPDMSIADAITSLREDFLEDLGDVQLSEEEIAERSRRETRLADIARRSGWGDSHHPA